MGHVHAAADWLVQAVMVGLAVASVLTWTVFVAKSLELAAAARRQRAVLLAVDVAASLDKAPADELVAAAQAELRCRPTRRRSRRHEGTRGLAARAARSGGRPAAC